MLLCSYVPMLLCSYVPMLLCSYVALFLCSNVALFLHSSIHSSIPLFPVSPFFDPQFNSLSSIPSFLVLHSHHSFLSLTMTSSSDNFRDQFLAYTRNEMSRYEIFESGRSSPPPPPPINSKQNTDGYYEYNEDIVFD
jgi:hypothetical protein